MEKSEFIALPKDTTPLIIQGDVIKSIQKIPDNSISVVVMENLIWKK